MGRKRTAVLGLLLAVGCAAATLQPALAAGPARMPGVTAEMSDPAFWAARQDDPDGVILTAEEIAAYNADTAAQEGTMVTDLRTAAATFDGLARREAVLSSAAEDARYYSGRIYDPATGEKAEWPFFQAMIDNCADPRAAGTMPVRYAVAVERTALRVFPSDQPMMDDPQDPDFDYQALSAVNVNDPLLLYLTSADGKYYMARSRDCSGWISAQDVAVCADRAEWLAAWDLPAEKLLVVYGSKAYTDFSNARPQTARRMLTQGTALELAGDLGADALVGGRALYHNYAVWLPVRRGDGGYEKQLALLPETAPVHVGYLPLTPANLAKVALATLGDVYGWGGMLASEDCSGMVRTIYSCFGLHIGRNGNWQWPMNMEKVDMTHMSMEEKRAILDRLPLGAALCFPGHEMFYLGKVEGQYYVVSSVGSIMSPDTGKLLSTREVMLSTLEVKRASGLTWLGALNQAFVPCYAKLEGKDYGFPALQWYHDGVAYCLDRELMPALDLDGTFGIGQAVTRGELARTMWTLAGQPEAAGDADFADLGEEEQTRTAVAWAASTGVMVGTGPAAFSPEGVLTRQQAVTVLCRFAQTQGLDTTSAQADLSGYADYADVGDYARAALPWACGVGLVVGAEGRLLPDQPVTREQLATILHRYALWSAPAAPAEA